MAKITQLSLHDWQESPLWHLLERCEVDEAEEVRTLLKAMMPDIQAVLYAAQTAPTDFTLHDAQHAFRVSLRMAEVVPADVLNLLSCYEIALLLFSAYLHDIGMTPDQKLIQRHLTFLLTGDPHDLSEPELDEFRDWLDLQGKGLPSGKWDAESLKDAHLLLTRYCRERHADWSVDWIARHLLNQRMGSYTQWLSDLSILCRSHNEGYDRLIQDDFDPRPVGRHGYIVNLRFLACVLRVADVLEFDPERTAPVVFQHRAISPGSVIYWHKDHDISLLIENDRIGLSARPSTARIHHAILGMATDIECELAIVRRLADEKKLSAARFQSGDLYHRWDITPNLRLDISPYQGAYEYIDGAFRPDTQRLLDLLSGVELYGDVMAAVRELLQNAFYAVREQIAYERLLRPDPAAARWSVDLGNLHQISVDLSQDGDDLWLICRDDGVGMSKAIIVDNLLVSGKAERPDLLRLERKCKSAGFSVGRTAQFGIGALSYFMIADLVRIRTRRSGIADGGDAHGWSFETTGVGAFGELRSDMAWQVGTEVRLRIRKSLQGIVRDRLVAYVVDAVAYSPSIIVLRIDDEEKSVIAQGWSQSPLEYSFGDHEYGVSSRLRKFLGANAAHREIEAIKAALRWEHIEGELGDGLGAFRLSVPVFRVAAFSSPAYFHANPGARETADVIELTAMPHDDEYLFWVDRYYRISWNGITVDLEGNNDGREVDSSLATIASYGTLQVDWRGRTAGTIVASRERLNLKSEATECVGALASTLIHLIQEKFGAKLEESPRPLQVLWAVLMHRIELAIQGNLWLYIKHSRPRSAPIGRVGKIEFPAVDQTFFSGDLDDRGRYSLRWRSIRVSEIQHLSTPPPQVMPRKGVGESFTTHGGLHYSWCDLLNSEPDRLLAVNSTFSRQIYATVLWERYPTATASRFLGGVRCRFPPLWSHLVGVWLRPYAGKPKGLFWNVRHPLVKAFDATADAWLRADLESKASDAEAEDWLLASWDQLPTFDPREHGEELLGQRAKAALWLGAFLCSVRAPLHGREELSLRRKLWQKWVRDSRFISRIWSSIFRAREASFQDLWFADLQATTSYSPRCWAITPRSFRLATRDLEVAAVVPNPGKAWTLVVDRWE